MFKIGKKLLYLSIACAIGLSANSNAISPEAKKAIEEINLVNEKTKVNQSKAFQKQKTEREIEAEKEKEAKKKDTKHSLDLQINALRNLKKSIDKSYTIADVEISTIGVTEIFVYEEELKRALSFLRERKELMLEIDTYLRSINSSKRLKSESFTNTTYNKIKSTYLTLSRKATAQSNAYEYKLNEKRVPIKEGLVANGIYAKRIGDFVELKIR